MLLAGDQSISKLDPSLLTEVINSNNNKLGKNVKVLVGTSKIKEGIDLKKIRQINITEPYTPEKSIERNRYLTAPDSAPIATLNAVANTVLCISIICGFALVFQAFYGEDRWTYLIGLGIFFCGLVQWATIRVFSGIAEDIRNIRMDVSRSTLKSMSQTENDLSE